MEKLHCKINTSNDKSCSLLKDMIDEDIDVKITVTGNSMLPLWRHQRDTVLLTKCNKNTLKKGDVPLYRRPTGQLVMHRIIHVNEDSYDMCGDAQVYIETNVPKGSIIAIAKSFTRKGKEYSCNCIIYKLYSMIWICILPVRRILKKVYRKMRDVGL